MAVVFSIQGMGIDDYDMLLEKKEKSSISNQVIEVSDHLQSVHMEKSTSVPELIREYKNNKRLGSFNKRNIILLVILTFLLGCFHTYIGLYGVYHVEFNRPDRPRFFMGQVFLFPFICDDQVGVFIDLSHSRIQNVPPENGPIDPAFRNI